VNNLLLLEVSEPLEMPKTAANPITDRYYHELSIPAIMGDDIDLTPDTAAIVAGILRRFRPDQTTRFKIPRSFMKTLRRNRLVKIDYVESTVSVLAKEREEKEKV